MALSRGRNTTGILLLLAVSIAIPAAVASSKTVVRKAAGIPSCASLSPTAMANLVGTGPLKLKARTGNLCTFDGQKPGHYRSTLQVEIIPYIKSVWSTAEGHAMQAHGARFGLVNSKLFFTQRTVTSAGKPACQPDQKVPQELGPACAGQPSENLFSAIGYGSYRSSGLKLMVSTAVTAQQGDVYLSHLLALVTQILSGKIH